MPTKKHGGKATIFGKTQVTPIGRLVFPELARPKQFENNAPKYSANLVVKPSDALTALITAVNDVGTRAFGPEFQSPQYYKPILPGEQVLERSEKADPLLYTGNYQLLAKGAEDKEPPKCYLPGKPPALMPRRPGNEDDLKAIQNQFYPGSYCRLAVTPFSFSVGTSIGVGLILKGVQFIKDGERLGAPDLDSAFGDPWDEEGFEVGDETTSAFGSFDEDSNDGLNI